MKGFADEAVIVNRAEVDFDSITANSTYPNQIENFPVLTGAEGYRLGQPNVQPFAESQQEMAQGTYFNTFTNTVHFLVTDNDAIIGRLIDTLANGEFVVILRKKVAVAGYQYIVMGLDTGLKATEMSRDFYDDDTLGAWAITLTEEGAPMSGRYLWKTDLATTEAILASLVTHTP